MSGVSESEFFGDFDVDDAWDNEPADPLQVARRLHLIRQRLERLIGGDLPDYEDLPERESDDLFFIAGRIVQWTRSNRPTQRFRLAEKIHEFARIRRLDTQRWDDLSDEEQELAEEIADLIANWLIRQGAWQ